ncbi:hypothetical protein [Actinoplanes sp. NBRC 103695]|uniref:hypothetical protein n=1 Tax=Actinoplanes sp. NBRC 103695 TaxID=3032202 RepID=UPI0024A005CA|nr:hypothetical protein [Actinoplanes sp. NBRC 103695]GLY94412.1 hypothetical protein Acsp02_16680 [Actinoplanes sp. NBRC 103695]
METTSAVRRAATWHRPLMILVAAMAILTVVTAVGVFTDDRELLGAPIWLKPFKFSVSILLYGLTLAWMISLLPRRGRLATWPAVVITGSLVVEMIVIVAQVIRGETSHYNESTPLNAALWQAMGAAIMILFVAHFIIGVAVLRARIPDRVSRTGVALGLGVSMLGLVAAFPMVMPSMSGGIEVAGAHTAGAADGGPGLPVVGWSTVAGDLRIGHFVGLHALQALPLLAWALARFATRLSERTKVRLLVVAGAGYAGLTGLLTWQALREQPLIHPDALTLTAFGILAAVVLGGATLIVRSDRADDLELAA